MSLIGTNVAQSLAGQAQAERAESAERKRAERPEKRELRTRKDEHDTVVVNVESIQAVRHLAGNDQEEAHEDRQEHPYYTPAGAKPHGHVERPRIDVEG